jgi:hypothetical protein
MHREHGRIHLFPERYPHCLGFLRRHGKSRVPRGQRRESGQEIHDRLAGLSVFSSVEPGERAYA